MPAVACRVRSATAGSRAVVVAANSVQRGGNSSKGEHGQQGQLGLAAVFQAGGTWITHLAMDADNKIGNASAPTLFIQHA